MIPTINLDQSASQLSMLPVELLRNELFLHLDAISILSFCTSDRSNNAICLREGVIPSAQNDASGFWLNRFAFSSYEERREDFLTLTARVGFEEVIIKLIKQKDAWIDFALIDDYHVRLVIAGRDDEARAVTRAFFLHPKYKKYLTLDRFSMRDIPAMADAMKERRPINPIVRGHTETDKRLYPIVDALYDLLDENEICEYIISKIKRRGYDQWALMLLVALVRKNRAESIAIVRSGIGKLALRHLIQNVPYHRPAFTHPIYRYSPRERAYYWFVRSVQENNSTDFLKEFYKYAEPLYNAYIDEMKSWYEYYVEEYRYRLEELEDKDLIAGNTTLDPELDWVLREKDIETI